MPDFTHLSEYKNRMIELQSDNGITVRGIRAQDPPQQSGGYGRYDLIVRPNQISATHWSGRDPARVKVPLMFDAWRERQSIEQQIINLHRMALPGAGGEPPRLKVVGAHPARFVAKWVIESIDWGTNVIWVVASDGVSVRVRQDVVVNLLQWVEEDRAFKRKPVGSGTSQRPKPKNPFHTVKRGETLQSISVKEYGKAKYWRDIAKANKIRDPKKIKLRQRLRMPK
jgi:LysM repeat protein